MPYPGGKSLAGVPQWIISLAPAHVLYCAPFAGHDAVFEHKPPAFHSMLIDRDIEVVRYWRKRLKEIGRNDVTVFHECGIEFLERWAGKQNVGNCLFYLDPPYLLKTRVKKKIYRYEMTDADHLRMLHAAKRIDGPVMISGYFSEMYADELQGWRLHKRWVTTRGSKREEHLWVNERPAPVSAISVQYGQLGSDYRERERVKKKVSRWRSKFQTCTASERRAILLELIAIDQKAFTAENGDGVDVTAATGGIGRHRRPR